jgi:hypothetical protein
MSQQVNVSPDNLWDGHRLYADTEDCFKQAIHSKPRHEEDECNRDITPIDTIPYWAVARIASGLPTILT